MADIKIYKRKNQRRCIALLLDAVRFERTRFSEVPQIKWTFLLDFGNAALEYELWTPTEFTADSRVSGFISMVTSNPYPEEPGVYCIRDFINKAAPAVWGLRKNPKGEKETILRFYPYPQQQREIPPEKAKSLGPSYIPTNNPEPTTYLPSTASGQAGEEVIKTSNQEEITSQPTSTQTKEIINYSLKKGDEDFFYNLMEVPVELDFNDRFKAELDKTSIHYDILRSNHILIQLHSRGLAMLQEDLIDKFNFIQVKRESK